VTSLAQLVGHAVDAPSHTKFPEHAGLPGVRATTALQLPAEPIRLQASQPPAHAELQHTPSTQKPETHWSVAAHACPFGFFGTQAPEAQYVPAAQVESSTQFAGQDAFAPSHSRLPPHAGTPAAPLERGVQAPT
jgi:hypothetical protein